MVENNAKADGGSEGQALEGQWINVLQTGSYGADGDVTSKDLDDLVSEYQARTTDKAPVVLGRAKADAPPVGTVDAIRRKGDVLQAKFSKVDSRVEQLHRKGVFKKRSAMLARSPEGTALSSVGLVSPQWSSQLQREDDELTPSLDDLHKQTFGTQSVVFNETRNLVTNTGRICVGANSVRLTELAKQRASEKSITFSEALDQVAKEQPQLTVNSLALRSSGTHPFLFNESGDLLSNTGQIRVSANSVRLTELAKQRASEKSITFSEALDQVAKEEPELTVSPFALGGGR